MSKQKTILKKINEIKKLKKLFQKVCNLLNDPIEMKDTALRNEAYHEACSNIQERMLNRSKQCLGFSSRPLLHRNSSAIDEQRERIGDGELREAEKIYRRKDPVYAKAVDQHHAEITKLLTEIENCRYFLQDTFQKLPWIKDTLLAGDFEYFRKYYKDLNKPWFVGEISEILEKLDKIQYALEREQKPEKTGSNSNAGGNEAYIPFKKAIELSNGVLTRKRLNKAIEQGEPIKVRSDKPSKQRKRVHIQDVLSLIENLSEDNKAGEEAARMFGEYKKTLQEKIQKQTNLD